MVLGCLLAGMIIGSLAAIVGLATGFTLWGALGLYVLGGAVGVLLAGLGLVLNRRPRRWTCRWRSGRFRAIPIRFLPADDPASGHGIVGSYW